MAKAYRMTPARKAALRKAQLASARKRKRSGGSAKSSPKGRSRRGSYARTAAKGVVAGAAIGAVAYYGYNVHKSIKGIKSQGRRDQARIRVKGRKDIRRIKANEAKVRSALHARFEASPGGAVTDRGKVKLVGRGAVSRATARRLWPGRF